MDFLFLDLQVKLKAKEIKNYCEEWRVTDIYRVDWLDFDGEIKIVRGFKTSEKAHEWIRTHHFDDSEFPMVFYDGEFQN